MRQVDGSHGEGGGQLLRTAIALSTLTGEAVSISKIRANRPKPGLSPSHCTSVEGVASISGAKVEGNHPGSTELTFVPGEVATGEHPLDVGTAGSISLVLQALMLSAVRCTGESVFVVKGGTNVKWSPPIDHYSLVLFPMLRRMGLRVKMEVVSRGFYPQGGGEVRVTFGREGALRPLVLEERGELQEIGGVCFAQNLHQRIPHEIASSVRKRFLQERVRISQDLTEGRSTGTGICLAAVYEHTVLGAEALGERGYPAEAVGKDAAQRLRAEMDGQGTLDVHTSDQLLPYMALAEGQSVFTVREISGHLRTQMDLLSEFLGTRFEVEGGTTVWVLPSRTLSA